MDSYSRLIGWLKILLPLSALGLLSTIFLVSEKTNPIASIPFTKNDIEDRLYGQQVTEPFFSGTTREGDQLTFSASAVQLGQGLDNRTDDLSVQIKLASGTSVFLSSNIGKFDIKKSLLTLQGDVVISTSTGYVITTDKLITDLDEFSIETTSAISGKSPIGTLNAGKMRLDRILNTENVHLNFTNGVKLLYRSINIEE